MIEAAEHMMAFSALLARDPDAGLLNARDLQVLAFLVAERRPVIAHVLADRVKISRGHSTKVVEKLVQRGLVIRTHDSKDDRRVVMLSPSKKGIALDKRVKAHFRAAKVIAQAVA